jgi:hypothetical protein
MDLPLKPIVYTSSNLRNTSPQSKTEQLFLLKSLQVTQDPKELQKLLGLRTVAQVYQTMDKLSMRKEYHAALSDNGVSFDFIVKGIKDIAVSGFKDADKLNAFKVLLKSVGMESYEDTDGGSKGNWEEIILNKINEEKDEPLGLYKVNAPQIPESVKKQREEEREVVSSIYEI